MNKIITLAVAFLLFIPFASINGNNVSLTNNTNGNILYVGGSGPNNYTSIQSAINDADNGYTIYVYSGIYREHVRIYKSISLIGENENTTIIDGMNENAVIFTIESSDVKFSHFTIRNISTDGWTYGIVVTGNNITISNCIIKNADGLELYSMENGLIENCNFSHNYWGIFFLTKCKNITIRNCTLTHNLGKKWSNGGYRGGDGIDFMFDAKNFYNISIINCNLSNNRFSGIYSSEFENLYVKNCRIQENKWGGIQIYDMKNVSILDCEIKNNAKIGVDIMGELGNIFIKNCNITGTKNESGISILNKKSGKIYIDSCNIKNNNRYGIDVVVSYDFKIRYPGGIYIHHNNIYSNKIGVHAIRFSMVDARYNYWGSPLGPSHLLGLRGDRIQTTFAKVFYFPWLKEEYVS
ncbi:MAG TPA: hypothetical protein ENJ25_02015 [Firmicutes bacterium]|nr:hypothetical protein [Bacillota bacterium]